MDTINLHEIALKLLANSAIAEKITGASLVFTAKQLAAKLPVLNALGDISLISLRKDEQDKPSYVLPTLYRDGALVDA